MIIVPRKARQTSPEAIYHITCRSISEIPLFKSNDDKNYFLKLLKRYKNYYKCSIYGYSLMTTHYHIHFDGLGTSVSKFMHSLNTAYVHYFNKKHQRHGVLFQDRFYSRILSSDSQNLIVSAYIHNNPDDISEFKGKAELYPYSSYGIYLGIRKDLFDIIDKSLIYSLIRPKSGTDFSNKYFKFVSKHNKLDKYRDIEHKTAIETEYEYNSGRTVILRDLPPQRVITLITDIIISDKKYKDNNQMLAHKYKWVTCRALCAYALRVWCGLSYKQICNKIQNISVSGCASLCNKGMELFENNEYTHVFKKLSHFKVSEIAFV